MLVNLHTHLEGRIRPSTAAELAAEAGVLEPDGGWERALELEGPADLTVYLAKVAASYPLLRSPHALERVAREAVEDAAASGQDYLEVRFGPATHVDTEHGLDDAIAAVARGLADGAATSGTAAGAVVAALRHHDADTNVRVAHAAARHAGSGVVGFDLAGDELRHPDIAPYASAFQVARAAGLGLTCHAAEAAPAAAVRDAVDLLGATRIGHGAHMADDEEVVRWAAGEGVIVEICPTSNWYTGAIAAIERHPSVRLREVGVPLVLGDDNPVQTGSDLAAERVLLAERLGWGSGDLRRLDQVSVEAAFAEPSVRSRLRATLRSTA